MRRCALFFLLFFFMEGAAAVNHLRLVNGCTIHDFSGDVLQVFPGSQCLFLTDGSIISATSKTLRRLGRDNQILWEIRDHFHHQLALSPNKDKILALSSRIIKWNDRPHRVDKFLIISMDGKIIYNKSVDELLDLKAEKRKFHPLPEPQRIELETDSELSHFNSFYEVPKLSKASATLKEGMYVVNGLEHGILVLTSDLSKVHFRYTMKGSAGHSVHDVQVTPRGTFLLFNNKAGPEELPYSAIMEIPLSQKSPETIFSATPPETFYSPVAGNVQELDEDTYLFTNVLTGTFVYSRQRKRMIHATLKTHANESSLTRSLSVRAQDLTEFFRQRRR